MLRSLNKHFSLREVRRTIEILGEQGIRRMGFLLLGGPGETRETVEESLAFADSLPIEALKITARHSNLSRDGPGRDRPSGRGDYGAHQPASARFLSGQGIGRLAASDDSTTDSRKAPLDDVNTKFISPFKGDTKHE